MRGPLGLTPQELIPGVPEQARQRHAVELIPDHPALPAWDHLAQPAYLGNLRRAGVEPADVDLVINTHVHVDHVWEESYRIGANLLLAAALGHTPGSSVVKLVSVGKVALFTGDLLHSPVQVVQPDASSCFCTDPARSRATRRRLLGWAADTGALVLPAHFSGRSAIEVRRVPGAFAISGWAPFSRY